MIDIDYCRRMAQYNRWMNAKLYDAAARLSDEARKRDRGAFFKSIHRTLEHLAHADRAWLNRFTGRLLDDASPAASIFDDFAQLRTQRDALDREIADWVETLTPEWLRAEFRFYSTTYHAEFARPAWLLVTHLFNHQAHHRGQITTLLVQAGVDPGATDLPVMPDLSGTSA